jgi:hypothetical protein
LTVAHNNGRGCQAAVILAVAPGLHGGVAGAGLPGLVFACGGLLALARRRREKIV